MRFGDVAATDFAGEDLPHHAPLRTQLQFLLRPSRVKRAREDMALRGLPFLGRNAVLRQSFSAVPKTPAPRRNPSPRIAAKSTPARVDAIRRMLEFLRQYRAAWCEWRDGNRAAVFPLGTYALRIYARVACAQAVPA